MVDMRLTADRIGGTHGPSCLPPYLAAAHDEAPLFRRRVCTCSAYSSSMPAEMPSMLTPRYSLWEVQV
jgi:hypothetical protein